MMLQYSFSFFVFRIAHLNIRRHKCEICHKTFKYTSQFSNHVKEAHGVSGNYPCKVCGKIFKSAKKVRLHSVLLFLCGPKLCYAHPIHGTALIPKLTLSYLVSNILLEIYDLIDFNL